MSDKRSRRLLSNGGVLVVDPDLPFLLVHREPEGRADPGTARLISGEASFLAAHGGESDEACAAVRQIAEEGSSAHGAFVVLEIWTASDPHALDFTLRAPAGPAPETTEKLLHALESLRNLRPGVDVKVETSDRRHPPDLPPLLGIAESWQKEILLLGLEIPPVFRDPRTGQVYPRFLRRLQRSLSSAIRQALYEFIRVQTSARVSHHLALGSRTLPDAVWMVDRSLCAIEHSFNLLLFTSPVNAAEAWERFAADGYQRNPRFHYRLLPVDPDVLKRRLFAIEMEAIDDPAVADLFQDKRQELDTQLTMLGERETACFRFSSQRLYGTVADDLHAVAVELLENVPLPRRNPGERVDARAFRDAAVQELAFYRERYPALDRRIDIRPDVTGLMVAEGNLLIGTGLQLDPARVDPLLQHEVGTHVLTYVNGRAQPLEQLSLGLANYDEFQEGLAVLSEYLVGGLDRLRMRLLAARVLAARSIEEGAEFVDTFRLLRRDYGYSAPGAWQITVRVHQSGGFTRDFIYLRGLLDVLRVLREGVDLGLLYIGKIARKHIGVVEELRHRGIFREAPLTPRYLEDPDADDRLAAVRRGVTLMEMICPEAE